MDIGGQVGHDDADDDADLVDDLDGRLDGCDELDDLLLSEADDGTGDTSCCAGGDGHDGGCGSCDGLDDGFEVGLDDGSELDDDFSLDVALDLGHSLIYNTM